MNKAELIDAIAAEAELPKSDVAKMLNAFVNTTQNTLGSGDTVALVGFGTFSVSERKERTGRNPQTGAAITIAAKKLPVFKAGKALKEAVDK